MSAKNTHSTSLFDLVNSLSTNEKRYFKLFTANSSGDKNYQKLFNAIGQEKISDKKALKKRMSHTTMNVSYEKKYLQKILMRALRNFHEDSSSEIILHQTLTDIEILFNKQNYELCLALVKNAMPIAEENEHFTMLLQLLKWLRRIMIRRGQYDEVARQNKVITEKERFCLRMLENQLEYKDIQAQFLALLSQKGNARHTAEMEDFKKLIRNPILKDEKLALSHGAKLLFFDCWSWYYQHTLQVEKAYELCHRMVRYLESQPDKILLHPQSYMSALSSLANRCTNFGKYDEALTVIEKMEKMHEIRGLKIPKSLQTEILTFSVERRLMIYGFNREFKKGIEWFHKTKAEVDRNRKALRPTFLSMYNQLAALCFLHNGDYDNALKHLRIVLDEVDDKQRSDTFLYAHMLHIMTHFELKNYQLLPYLIKSVQRFGKSRNFIQQTVSLFLKMFSELYKKNDKKSVQAILALYYPKFEKLNKVNSESVIMGTIDLSYWMEQKMK